MHFCSVCHNMYYLKISDTEEQENGEINQSVDTLIYYCRNCGNEDKSLTVDNVCVSETQLTRSEQKYTHMVNEYTKYDTTLPRINTIKCPNQDCKSNNDSLSGQGGGGGGSGSGKESSKSHSTTSKKTKLIIKPVTTKKKLTTINEDTLPVEEMKSDVHGESNKDLSNTKLKVVEDDTDSSTLNANDDSLLTNNEREVIYIRYDDTNMKYVYVCVHCDTLWKTDNRS